MDNQFEKQNDQSEEFHDYFLDGNEQIKEAIANFYNENNREQNACGWSFHIPCSDG